MISKKVFTQPFIKPVKNITPYLQLMRLHRPIGIYLLLWPTLSALWIANQGKPSLKILIIFILGVIIMRSAGCIINDLADRNFDLHVARTKNRPLIEGLVSLRAALILFFILLCAALLLVMQLNKFTNYLACIAVLLACLYPFTKRYTYWPQFFLGAAYSFSIPMAFAASQNHVSLLGWYIYLISILWPIAYDTIYAMVDRRDDLKIGVKSTAILFGEKDTLIIGIINTIFLCAWLPIGITLKLNGSFYLGLLLAAAVIIYQQYLIQHRSELNCFKAFLISHWAGAAIFAGIVCAYW